MTVRELIKLLKKCDPDALVVEPSAMSGLVEVQGIEQADVRFIQEKERNGEGTHYWANSRTRKRIPAVMLHCDPEQG